MSVQPVTTPLTVTITVPDELAAWLIRTAEENFRTPEGQLLWLLTNIRGRNEEQHDNRAAAQQLHQEIRKLQLEAGQPSIRAIAERTRRAGQPVAHSSVQEVLRGKRLPTWTIVEAVVNALHGDRLHFLELWMQAKGAK